MGDSAESSGEEALVQARRQKAEAARAQGKDPFSNQVELGARTSISEIRQRYVATLTDVVELRYDGDKVAELSAGERVTVFGRLMARRGFGKASFLRLRDSSGEFQLFAKKDVLGDAFSELELLDIGDHVAASGEVMVTKTGELSLQLTELKLLSKALRPLPDKWAGLTDVDTRYRRRYVDMVANPEVRQVLAARASILRSLRRYLDKDGFLEVETPSLHTLIGGAAARPFNTHHYTLDLELFLRIAPELYLKRLLVGGIERVYEIGRCYRNEGISTRHNPEFTMVEYYQAYATYQTLMDATERMLRYVDQALAEDMKRLGAEANYAAWFSERNYTLGEPFVRLPMRQGIERALELAKLPKSLLSELSQIAIHEGASPSELEQAGARIKTFAGSSERAASIDWRNFRKALGGCDNDGERVFIAYEYLVEPFLTEDYRSESGEKSLPVFIIDYPAEVSPLARRKDSDPSLVDRFELFIDGRELCNAFSELNDPDDQASRFREQVQKKSRGQHETMDYDEDYIRALEHGMPPAAGFGLGVDRLVMMLANQSSIRDVIAFPLLRPESKPE